MLLHVENLHVSYGAVHAVQGVSLHVAPGEIVTLIGSNGAGKTTLLRAVSGLVRPSAGAIVFDGGQRLDRLPPHAIVRAGVSHVPEGRQVFGNLTVRENLELGAYQRRDRAASRATLERVFELFPVLAERLPQSAATLSGGEQQMLAIGRALMAQPRLLLLDEPSLGLAPLVVQTIFAIMREINSARHHDPAGRAERAHGAAHRRIAATFCRPGSRPRGQRRQPARQPGSARRLPRRVILQLWPASPLPGPRAARPPASAASAHRRTCASSAAGGPPAVCRIFPRLQSARCRRIVHRMRKPALQTRLLIGGDWSEAMGKTAFQVHEPATGALLANVADAGVDDALAALDAAHTAQPGWAAQAPRRRSDILRGAYERMLAQADRLAELIVRENGKPIAEARGEVRLRGRVLPLVRRGGGAHRRPAAHRAGRRQPHRHRAPADRRRRCW